MSRSIKKSPCLCYCGNTNKKSKQHCNRKFRKLGKAMLRDKLNNDNIELFDKLKEVVNIWSFNRDGKAVWIKNVDKKYLRK